MNLFELFCKIGVKDEASDRISSIASKLGGGLKSAAAVGVAGVTAAGTAIAVLTKKSLDAVADYEQQIGGVETLFESAADTVIANSEKAYKTAGLSAREYMANVTSFAASLKQGLGGDVVAAAKAADTAMIDMSDNANKMGTSMESIQNAYQGFAKQNYTMLDNLKLGYGGTKTEMERLLADANELNKQQGIITDYSISNFADIIDAIHVVQQDIGITGTTTKEASTTITGSMGSAKAAWDNFLSGASNINQFTDTITTAVGNIANNLKEIVPRITQGLTTMIQTLAPQIPPLIEQLLPVVITGATSLITAFSTGLPEIIQTILPSVVTGALTVVQTLVSMLPEIVDSLRETIPIVAKTIVQELPVLIQTALQVIMYLADQLSADIPKLIPIAVETVLNFTEYLIDNIDMLIDAAIQIIIALSDGIINSLPVLLEKAPVIVQKLVDAIINNAPKLLSAAYELIAASVRGIVTNLPQIVTAGGQIASSLAGGILNLSGKVVAEISSIMGKVKNAIKEAAANAFTWGSDMIRGFINGIKSMIGSVASAAKNIASTIKSYLHFSVPDVGPLTDYESWMPDFMQGLANGIDKSKYLVTDALNSLSGDMTVNPSVAGGFSGGFGGTININIQSGVVSDMASAQLLAQQIQYELRKIDERSTAAIGGYVT